MQCNALRAQIEKVEKAFFSQVFGTIGRNRTKRLRLLCRIGAAEEQRKLLALKMLKGQEIERSSFWHKQEHSEILRSSNAQVEIYRLRYRKTNYKSPSNTIRTAFQRKRNEKSWSLIEERFQNNTGNAKSHMKSLFHFSTISDAFFIFTSGTRVKVGLTQVQGSFRFIRCSSKRRM